MSSKVLPLLASSVPPRSTPSVYPQPFAQLMEKRVKRQLGNYFGLKKFGINLTSIESGGVSALKHRHSKQEEFIYVISGKLTLVLDNEEHILTPGMCYGFTPNTHAHQIVNQSNEPVVYLEVGDRESGDMVEYPDDDLKAESTKDGTWIFKHKDGKPY